jgi:tetratricopeptide (TPR) repeat protein
MAEMDQSLLDGMNRAERNAFLDGIQADLDAVAAARENEDWEAALAGSQALLERFPTILRLQTDVGEALTRLQRYEEAIEAYEAAVAADPALRSQVETTIARLRAAMGDSSAVESLIASGDAAREDYYNLGTAAFGRGAADEAAEWFERATAADPSWVLPVYQLGLVSLNTGDMEGAKAHFARAVELDPASTEGQQAQAILSSLP